MEVIPSANVGLKINEWHMYINRFDDVRNAEKVKAEVEQMIDVMEENKSRFTHILSADRVQTPYDA
ncbi:hypothetical protein ACLE91_02470 [Bacillus subtilis]|uniref:response regulator aspartate phosphatase n=1 Tax=Bacillus subtilis TaxID=1423 RepID=UPI003D301E33